MSFYSQEEIEKAKQRTDLEGIKGKTLKLNMDNEEDKLLHLYLEDKSFTDVVKQALRIYKKHFDPNILQERELQRLEASQSVTPLRFEEEAIVEPTVSKEVTSAVKSDMDEF